MSSAAAIPGLTFTVAPPKAEPSPLRSDVAGFIGETERGPVGRAVRVQGWREYLRVFGGLVEGAATPYAIRGYFESGGEVAHVVRLAAEPRPAEALWTVGAATAGIWRPLAPLESGFGFAEYRLVARSPGTWGNELRAHVVYFRDGAGAGPEIDVVVEGSGEAERFDRVPPARLVDVINAGSDLVHITGLVAATPSADPNAVGPRACDWELRLENGSETPPAIGDYLAAVESLGDRFEVALVSLPDLHRQLGVDDALDVLAAALEEAEGLLDRMVLIDVPRAPGPSADEPATLIDWTQSLSDRFAGRAPSPLRAAALYHPHLEIADPLGGIVRPSRLVPPSGHVAGVISRLDRERGAHHTPANAEIFDAFDGSREYTDAEQAVLNPSGINLIRCLPGRGLNVWGGRTLDRSDVRSRWIAHRRLIHRLVRAIRRVAEPLVFDTNGPELWFALSRAVTTVLLESYRAGGLAGDRPEQAFRVTCNAETNPPEERDLGRCWCHIELAPATPMELIELRVGLSQDGAVEVIEA